MAHRVNGMEPGDIVQHVDGRWHGMVVGTVAAESNIGRVVAVAWPGDFELRMHAVMDLEPDWHRGD